MSQSNPKIGDTRPVIRQLDDAAINRIAAGEVVERPASAVKELVENAIDAGARRISVDIADGGKTLIRVTDDGCGMSADDLPLALSRHATSKIDGTDLLNINSFGFRGEALPSLGAVGRLTITSRAAGFDGAQISVSGGAMSDVKPAALNAGTVVELRDLFFATPARLKFMRTDRAETQAVSDVIKRLAMAEPSIGFALRDVSQGDTRLMFRVDPESGDLFNALHGRLARILGQDFAENALAIDTERDGLRLTGYAALPTYSRGAAVMQFFFVNGRPVKDKLLLGALRGPMPIFCRATVIRPLLYLLIVTRIWSTSTCILPNPKFAFAILVWHGGWLYRHCVMPWPKRVIGRHQRLLVQHWGRCGQKPSNRALRSNIKWIGPAPRPARLITNPKPPNRVISALPRSPMCQHAWTPL